jgi:hypothetical protein
VVMAERLDEGELHAERVGVVLDLFQCVVLENPRRGRGRSR